MAQVIHPQVIDATGEIVGEGAGPTYGVTIHGYLFSETGGTSAAYVDMYSGADAGSKGTVTAPSAAGTHIGRIQIPAGTTVSLLDHVGVYHKNGVYMKAGGAGTVLGQVFRS